jgi:hypothetical protein
LLSRLGAPQTKANMELDAWQRAEGGSSDNPFNTALRTGLDFRCACLKIRSCHRWLSVDDRQAALVCDTTRCVAFANPRA